ncbi:endonuclease [Comamonadaceae bacterium OH3737_COT-264]|nr:endonuclease [Comamonadaceae bacterium OH3737_COT-264]
MSATLLLTLCTAPLILLTVLPFFKARAWWVRIWDFPRLQLAILLALAALAQVWWLDVARPAPAALLAATLASLGYQLWWILPYTRLWRREVRWADAHESGPRLRMLSANVLTPNRNAPALLALIAQHRPDIVVTLESDEWWQAQLAPLHAQYPHRLACPLDNLYGMHLYSRLPLDQASIEFLVEADVPSMHASVLLHPAGNGREAVRARLHVLHPAPPSPNEADSSTERDVELVMVAKSLEQEDGPIIVAGDLNDVGWSPTTRLFRKISGLLDPRVGRGMLNSFHAHYWFARWPLDHFFHSDHFELVGIHRLPTIGSDHFPVMIELQYHPANKHQQEGLQASGQDRQEARAFLREQEASAADVPEPAAQEGRRLDGQGRGQRARNEKAGW